VTAGQATGDLISALQQVLSCEHAAVYGYGLVGGQLTRTEESTAMTAFVAHESRRDVVRRMILDRGAVPVAALPAYRPKVPVVSRVSALQLAAALEDDCMAAYVQVVGATDDPTLRRSAAGWLADATVRDELWRARISPLALSQAPPLPGLKPPPLG
jgi:hypothetical protein